MKPFHKQFQECYRAGVSCYQGELKPRYCTKYEKDCRSDTCKHERWAPEELAAKTPAIT